MQKVQRNTIRKFRPSSHDNLKPFALMIKKILPFLFLLITAYVPGQTWLYFQDSPDPVLYDYSWMELTPPSQLERKGNDQRKFPVETATPPIQGSNSLRLKWTSHPAGNWFAIAAGANWAEKDISDSDTLLFWLYSPTGQTAATLPKVFFEDVQNRKSAMIPAGNHTTDLLPDTWTRMAIPMNLFLNQIDPIDYTAIKTIGFAQYQTDGEEHTLFVDDMRVIKGDGSSPPVSPPSWVTAKGYERHADIRWGKSPENNVSGYQVFRSTDGGQSFTLAGTTGKNDTVFSDYTGPVDNITILTYGIKAMNDIGEPSELSGLAETSLDNLDDEGLLDMVQEATFRYFWDYGHPVSGMARERLGSGETVTSGGTGFGIMGIVAGIHRGFITRQDGLDRMHKIVDFLATADRFHGAWPHWMNGTTGKVIPFSTKDNGGDLVETAFLVQGLLTARSYFDGDGEEATLRSKITQLWETVEWDWYRKNNSDVLYWHWSPNYQWSMNMQIRGFNETMIVYLLAIASPTHGVPASLYHTGWAGASYYTNGRTFYGYQLDVGWDYGGPLFFTHYSFLGFDPRNKKDAYTNYFNNNRNTALIHHAYCVANPRNHPGYGDACWGLTASDDPDGYAVHEPTAGRDNGTITPSAALSSMPYTPEESMKALKHFYRNLPKTWGWYGFYDAFNQRRNWWADSYLAIDQGPIIGMIENHRSGLLWNLFMENPGISQALENIGFVYDPNTTGETSTGKLNLQCSYQTSTRTLYLDIETARGGSCSIEVINASGIKTSEINKHPLSPGINHTEIRFRPSARGLYIIIVKQENMQATQKFFVW